MVKSKGGQATQVLELMGRAFRKCVFSVLSIGPVPVHIAFIMDGNRRYAKRYSLLKGDGHRLGYLALLNMLRYCYELGVKYVTVYAFSIDNFRRRPEEVQSMMKLMEEKIEELIKEESMVNRYGVRIYFPGNLKLLSESVRLAAEKAMAATACNSEAVLSICIAYTSRDEIVHAVQECCAEKRDKILLLETEGYSFVTDSGNEIGKPDSMIDASDIEKHMYASVAPDPDIIVRTAGETRLSNFLLWQSSNCLLYSPSAFWPDIGFRHLVWAVLDFQKNFSYLKQQEKKPEASPWKSHFQLFYHSFVWSVFLVVVMWLLSFSFTRGVDGCLGFVLHPGP